MFCSHKLIRKLNKKGKMSGKVVGLIVVLITVVVMFILLMLLLTGVFGEEAIDTMCGFFSVTRFTATGPAGMKYGILPDRCVSRPEDVYPTKWSKCDEKYKDDPNKCAAQQIVDLTERCWKMRGRGESDPKDIECFTACVHSCGEFCDKNNIDFKISHNTIKNVIRTTNMTGTDELYSKYIKPSEIVWGEWSIDENIGPTEYRGDIKGGQTWGIAFYDNWDIAYSIEVSDDRISINYKFPCYE